MSCPSARQRSQAVPQMGDRFAHQAPISVVASSEDESEAIGVCRFRFREWPAVTHRAMGAEDLQPGAVRVQPCD
jgi:hypothetical protein